MCVCGGVWGGVHIFFLILYKISMKSKAIGQYNRILHSAFKQKGKEAYTEADNNSQ